MLVLTAILLKRENKQKDFRYFNKLRNLFVDRARKNMDNTSMKFLSAGVPQKVGCFASVCRYE